MDAQTTLSPAATPNPPRVGEIALEHLTKQFKVRTTRRRFFLFGGPWGMGASRRILRALDDVNLTVPRGELLGIVGMNGSGKSTLLKMIAGISEPTDGSVQVNGRIGSLIEVGAGFHPELSGYENVYLNGTILGIPRARVDELLPSIVEFAGLEGFMDMPVKHYSSGMHMRLGFAIAIQIDPDILLLDETMAVGDVSFQPRALLAIDRFREKGVTTLMVSHDVLTVRQYCSRVLWLHEGKVRALGDPHEVVESYRDFLARFGGEEARRLQAMRGLSLYNGQTDKASPLKIESLSVADDDGKPSAILDHPGIIRVRLTVRAERPGLAPRVCVALVRRDNGAVVIEKDTGRESVAIGPLPQGASEIRLTLEPRGLYSESLRAIAALYEPSATDSPLDRRETDFDLVNREQPIPESCRYVIAPVDGYRNLPLAPANTDHTIERDTHGTHA